MTSGYRQSEKGEALARQESTAEAFCLDRVSLTLEGRTVFDGLSARSTGRRIGIVGRNGAGKSTLARLLAGLVPATSGSVSVDGFDPAADRRAALDGIGILFQNPEHQIIFPTVLEEITFGLRQQGQTKIAARDMALQVLARHNRAHWQDRPTHALSQGQKHLLCLMAVEAMTPRLLILDEPFAGLDIPTHMRLSRHLADWPGRLVHISHDPRDVSACDDLLWLEAGEIRAQGPAAEVLPVYLAAMEEEGARDDIADLPA